MVLENFYNITSKKVVDENKVFSYDILINNKHPIFEGHFPDNPIMPGVCMMQITKEITEELTNSTLFMRKCSNVKFTAIINPEINKNLNLQIVISTEENGDVKVKNITKFDETIALKLTAYYKKAEQF